MRHVFVETNWVVDVAAPSYWRKPEAVRLLDRAREGELRLHLPGVCLHEARETIRRKFTARGVTDAIGHFLTWGTRERHLARPAQDAIRGALGEFKRTTQRGLAKLSATLNELREEGEALEVFPMDDAALELQIELGAGEMRLKSIDEAILAAVVSRARSLGAEGAAELCFCELDNHLQPWTKNGGSKPVLLALYDAAGVWVYGDYALQSPKRPAGWPERPAD